jgi:hypothetical protein
MFKFEILVCWKLFYYEVKTMKQVTDVGSMTFNVVITGCGDIDNPNWCDLLQERL